MRSVRGHAGGRGRQSGRLSDVTLCGGVELAELGTP